MRDGVIGNTPTFGVGDFQVRTLVPQPRNFLMKILGQGFDNQKITF